MKPAFIIAFCFALSSCATTAALVGCYTSQPVEEEPEAKEVKIAFKLDYKFGSENVTINETIYCNYEGLSCDGRGRYNEWSKRLSNGEQNITLTKTESGARVIYRTPSCSALIKGHFPQEIDWAEIENEHGEQYTGLVLPPSQLEKKFGIVISRQQYEKAP
ncbi:MAG: hypothetical protein V7752_20400 [Halopseudomonas sp.]